MAVKLIYKAETKTYKAAKHTCHTCDSTSVAAKLFSLSEKLAASGAVLPASVYCVLFLGWEGCTNGKMFYYYSPVCLKDGRENREGFIYRPFIIPA